MFLKLQGIAIGVSGLTVDTSTAGDAGEGDTGNMWRSEVGATTHSFSIQMPAAEDAEALALLLAGAGEVWSDSDYGSKGTLIEAGVSATHDGASHKFGTHYFLPSSAPDDFVDITKVDGVVLEEGWTVMLWHDDGGGFDHYGLCGDGLIFFNGAVSMTTALPFSVTSAGMLSLDDAGEYDDVVVLPFDMPSGWITQLDLTEAFAPLPALNMSGDVWHEPIVVEVESEVSASGVIGTDRWALSCVLREVNLGEFVLNPANMSDVAAWYDGQDLTTLWQDSGRTVPVTADGQTVEAWDDKSGNARHATNATSTATYVAAGINGMGAVDFPDDSGQSLTAAAFTWGTTGGLGAFLVMEIDTTDATDYALNRGTGGPIRVVFAIDAQTGVGPGFYDGSSHKAFGAPSIAAGDLGAWSIVFEAGGNATLRRNEVKLHASIAYVDFADVSSSLTIGGGTTPMDGRIGELLVLNREPIELERVGLTNYMRHRWRMP